MTLLSQIKKRAAVWSRQITTKAHANLGGKRSLIVVRSSVETRNNKVGVISVASPTQVSEYGDVKDVARAYEYGSGVHSAGRFGKRRRYIIKPRRKKVLAFFWDKVDEGTPAGTKFRGISKKSGKALFNFVEHPGVQAVNGGKGYLRPAITEVRKTMRREISKEMRDAYIGTFRKAFSKR
jgi:hypothetical protein